MSTAEYLSHSYAAGTGTLAVDKPAGTAAGHLLVAVGFSYQYNAYPAISPPDGWEQRGAIATRHHIFKVWTRLAGESEPVSYAFTCSSDTPASNITDIVVGCYRKVRAAAPLHQIGQTTPGTSLPSSNELTAPGITTTIDDCLLLFLGGCVQAQASGPDGWTLRYWADANPATGRAVLAEKAQETAGATGNITYTLDATTVHRRAMLLALAGGLAPSVPTISTPANLSGKAPGAILALTASATQPDGTQIKYRWHYNTGGSTDTLIGESALADSGLSGTYNWDTTGLSTGTYQLKCWAVSAEGIESSTYATITIYLADAVLITPAPASSHATGIMTITGQAYLAGEGSVRLQVELDTSNPPDDESEDYDLITSALAAQGEAVSVIGNITHLGTWYLRVRARDETAGTVSGWTNVLTIYALEALRLLSGSKVEMSALSVYNRVYAVAKNSDPLVVGVATNTTINPTYTDSPREMWVEAPEGSDQAACDAIAAAKLALLQEKRTTLSGLKVSIVDGLKLHRGQRVGVQIDRLGLNTTLPVRELVYDLANATCEVVLGDFWEPRTDQDAMLAIAQKVQQIQKEAAG